MLTLVTTELAVNVGPQSFLADFGEEFKLTVNITATYYWRYGWVQRLLPSWPGPFVKFTGASGQIPQYDGTRHGLHITRGDFEMVSTMLAAFVHCTWVHTEYMFIPADLQGRCPLIFQSYGVLVFVL